MLNATTWPNADKYARLTAAGTLASLTMLYAVPESEATLWAKTTIATALNVGLICCAVVLGVCAAAWNGGKGLKIRLVEPETQAIEQGEEMPRLHSRSPYLTPLEKSAVENYTAQKLSVETAERVKAGMVAGLSIEEIARSLTVSVEYVRRIAGVLRTAPVDLDLEPLSGEGL